MIIVFASLRLGVKSFFKGFAAGREQGGQFGDVRCSVFLPQGPTSCKPEWLSQISPGQSDAATAAKRRPGSAEEVRSPCKACKGSTISDSVNQLRFSDQE